MTTADDGVRVGGDAAAGPPVWAVLATQLLVCVLVTLVAPASVTPWAQLLAAAAVVLLCRLPRWSGRPAGAPLPGRPRAAPAVDVVDLVSPDRSLVGCVDSGRSGGRHLVTTALEISAGADTVTELGTGPGSDAPDTAVRRVPLALLAAQLDAAGPALEGVDVCVEGRRSAPGPVGSAYAELVGPLPVVATRRVTVLLRLDLLAPGCVPGDAAPVPDPDPDRVASVVALATERVRRAVVHHGFPCRVLGTAELAELYLAATEAGTGAEAVVVPAGPGCRAALDRVWSTSADSVTETLRLRRSPGAPPGTVRVHATIGTTAAGVSPLEAAGEAGAVRSDRPGARPVPGERGRPTPRSAVAEWPVRALDALAPVAHGCGQILGATAAGRALAMPVCGPHLRSVLLAGDERLVRQVAFRAVAAGNRLAVVTDTPARWSGTAAALRGALHLSGPDAADPTVPVDAVFWDVAGPLGEARIDAFAGPDGADVVPPTVVRVVPTGSEQARAEFEEALAAGPDLVLDGRIPGWLSVERPGRGPVTVSVVGVPAEEQAALHP